MPLKKTLGRIAGLLLVLFAGTGLLNLLLGVFFTAWNRNRNHLGTDYVDAPYVYYKKAGSASGFEIPDSVSLQKDTGEYRILLLGGSVAYGLATTIAENGTSLLQQLLQEKLQIPRLRVLNGALPAYVSTQELLALQLQLRRYQPDYVVALHGYNDVESFRVNHHVDDSHFLPSPIFYAGDEFSPALQAVQSYKKTYTLQGVWEAHTRYIRKSVHFILRSFGFKRYTYENYSGVTPATLERYTNAYLQNIKDMKQFCDVNQIRYTDLLQPARFYRQGDSTYHRAGANDTAPELLAQLYYRMEAGSRNLSGHISLTHLDAGKLQFTDVCHPSAAGYRYLAQAITEIVAQQRQATTLGQGY